jgi:hypothetical protein
MAPDVLRLLTQVTLLSDRARCEAADLLAHYPTKAEIAAVLDNPEATLSTWLNVLLRCQRVFEIFVGFCQAQRRTNSPFGSRYGTTRSPPRSSSSVPSTSAYAIWIRSQCIQQQLVSDEGDELYPQRRRTHDPTPMRARDDLQPGCADSKTKLG